MQSYIKNDKISVLGNKRKNFPLWGWKFTHTSIIKGAGGGGGKKLHF